MELKKLKKALKKTIKEVKDVYIVGHDDIDLDAFGASIGLSLIVNKFKKKSYIIMNDKILEKGVSKALLDVEKKFNLVKLNDIKDKDLSKSLLIVVDTNKKYLVSCQNYVDKFKSIVILDHHNTDKDSINSNYLFIDLNISSTCELVTELIKAFHVLISAKIATLLFSGIVLDTNNFTVRANKKTFYNAYYLLNRGASTIEVQYLLKQDLRKFINREKMLTNVIIIDDKIAIARGVKGDIYRREDLAKIAETLLQFNKIETSFVIGNLSKEEVGVSGRTLGKTHIGNIMKKLNGGGNSTEGATKIACNNINQVEKELIALLK